MPKYRLSGEVTFVVTRDWETPMNPPTRADAIDWLKKDEAYIGRGFETVSISVASNATYEPRMTDDSTTISDRLRTRITERSDARMTVIGTTTACVEEPLYWEETPSEERVRDVLADKAPCSVLAIDTIENVRIQLDEEE